MKTAKFIVIMATSVTAGILASKGIEVGGRKAIKKGKEIIKKKLAECKKEN